MAMCSWAPGRKTCLKLIKKAVYADYAFKVNGQIVRTEIDLHTALDEWCFLSENYAEDVAEAKRINTADYKRQKRLKDFIADILLTCETAVFLTLTFSDETLEKTTVKTRRAYVQRYLRQHGAAYVANIDFGSENDREHYHAVIGGTVDLTEWEEKCGFAYAEKIRFDRFGKIPRKYKDLPHDEQLERMKADTFARLAKYTAKLTNHAIKATTKRQCLMYYAPNRRKDLSAEGERDKEE